MALDHTVAHKLVLTSFRHGPGARRKHYLRQSHMEERIFVEVQVSRGNISAYQQSEKYVNMCLDTLESLTGTVWLHLHPSFPRVAQFSQERPSQHMISTVGESESMWVSSWLPQMCRTLPKTLISLPPPIPSVKSRTAWCRGEWRVKEARKATDNIIGGH